MIAFLNTNNNLGH